MDVRCERCKTEYEFDDARITEAGVTVKCTTCGHVFKVKKKALFVTVPVKPDDVGNASAAPLTGPAPGTDAKEKPKEWKVRQLSGNVFTFKELTTLQKWIVERKVTREDEISLTGETWKRLGNIAELASFFQVVDDAQKAVQLGALQNLGLGMTPSGGYSIPPGAQQAYAQAQQAPTPPAPAAPQAPVAPVAPVATPLGSSTGHQTSPSFPAVNPASLGLATPGPAQITHFKPGTAPVATVPHAVPEPLPEPPTPAVASPAPIPATPSPAPAPAPVPQVFAPTPSPNHSIPAPAPYATKSAERRDLPKKGGVGGWLALLTLLALGGGGYWAYTQGMLPVVDELLGKSGTKPQPDAPVVSPTPREVVDAGEETGTVAVTAPVDAGVVVQAPVDVGSVLASSPLDAGSVAVAPVDAGTSVVASAPPDAGTVTASVPKKEPVRDFDWYMAQGDRLRDRDRAEQALDAYGKAVDMQPQRAEPYAGRGLALLDMGANVQAEAAFQQAIKLNPRYGVAVMGLAEAYRIQGKNADAVRYYQRYLEISPNGSEASVARSQIERLGK